MANPILNFFGFTIKKKEDEVLARSVVPPSLDDGSIVINQTANAHGVLGSTYNLAFDIDGQIKSESDLIRRYRELSQYPEVSEAIGDIVNEAIVVEDDVQPLQLNLDDLKISESLKTKIHDEFTTILSKLNFREDGGDLFEKWYIDGKIYLHIILDEKHSEGIKELRFIDPRKIKKVKNLIKELLPNGIEIIKEVQEYYLYNEKGISDVSSNGIRLSVDSVVYCHSGLIDSQTGMVQSYLHKAIRPANQLKMLEEAVIIYRYTRAPERRVFYIDVGNLPKGKAEQYVADMMNKFKNKLSYDAVTGEVADSKRHTQMMEDFWMPRRGDKSTEITTLPGGQSLGQLDDLEYFKDKLYHALNVPKSRFNPDQGFSIGRSDTISRDEIKFQKFISKLRNKFQNACLDILRVQLISRGIFSNKDWDKLKEKIRVEFNSDNYFSELKQNEILNTRLQTVAQMDQFVGKYVSKLYVQKHILKLTDEEIKDMSTEIVAGMKEDIANGIIPDPTKQDTEGN